MLARRFLYVIAGLIVLTLAAGIGWNLFQDQLFRLTFVPDIRFDAGSAGPVPDYRKASSWLSRPDLPDDPARWLPPGVSAAPTSQVAVFYVPPTTYFSKASWNAPLDNAESRRWLRLFAASEASAFNGTGAVWAPRYRSATLGAFLSDKPDASQALDLAYADVLRAFDLFISQLPDSRPILLAGHSQGTLHLLRLMRDRVAGKPLARRIVAAYLVGWPVSLSTDIGALGLPACTGAGQPGCMLSWQSFAEPAEPKLIQDLYERSPGLDGRSRAGTPMLCINPLTGAPATAAPASANIGALVPRPDFMGMDVQPGVAPARCDSSGLLLIGSPPKGFDRFVMPGNNYHVFDYALFWGNIRADAEGRARAFLSR